MDKQRLGKILSELRGDRAIDGMTKFTISSIEEGKTSYSVSKLIDYCKSLSVQLLITDLATDESYPVDSLDDAHSILQMLMKRWHINDYNMFKKTGIHYTPPKDGKNSLSINTMLAMLGVLHCKLDFYQK